MPFFDCAHYITIFGIESLFTNIPLEETINIPVNKLFENKTKVNDLTNNVFNLYWNWPLKTHFSFLMENTVSKRMV